MRYTPPLLICLVVGPACKDGGELPEDSAVDADADGFLDGTDCDDNNASVNPSATETPYNGLDDDCDAATPDDDLDGDGYAKGADCNDGDDAVSPGAAEICDGTDNNCDGLVDPEGSSGGGTFFLDGDGDGYGDATETVSACAAPEGYVTDGRDCDDDDASIWPGAEEICGDGLMNDCDATLQSAWASCSPSGALGLDDVTLKLVGEAEGDYAGVGVSGAGDVDGDGLSDILIGAFLHDADHSNAGATYLLRSSGALVSASGTLQLDQADLKLIGEAETDRAGYGVAFAGDVDGDGRDDLLVGAWGVDLGGEDAGAAYVVLSSGALDGASGSVGLAQADLTLFGEAAADEAGVSVAGAGDVDGDGRADLLLGSHLNDAGGASAGAAYLVLTSGALDGVGTTLGLANADLKIVGESESDWAGLHVATAGDVDGDGLSDIYIGSFPQDHGGPDAGAAYLLRSSGALGGAGGTLPLSDADLKLVGEASGDSAGTSVASAGDVDGDGRDDLLVGARFDDAGATNAGAAYLLLSSGALDGRTGYLSLRWSDLKLMGEAADNDAGRSVASAGDVDGDGRADVLVGAPLQAAGGLDAGAAYLLLSAGALDGATGTLDLGQADVKLVGEAAGDYAGFHLSSAGDTDGDGFDELLIGANGHDNSTGAAYLLRIPHY